MTTIYTSTVKTNQIIHANHKHGGYDEEKLLNY